MDAGFTLVLVCLLHESIYKDINFDSIAITQNAFFSFILALSLYLIIHYLGFIFHTLIALKLECKPTFILFLKIYARKDESKSLTRSRKNQ